MIIFMLFPVFLFSFGNQEKENKKNTPNNHVSQPVQNTLFTIENSKTGLIGTDDGLFSVDPQGKISAVWQGGTVKKILFTDSWIIMGSEGILLSNDLKNWEPRNQGLPVKTIKIYKDKNKSFLQIVQELKDIKVSPSNSNDMVCTTKDRVYISRDKGLSWTNLGSPPYLTNGLKTAALITMPETETQGGLTVFVSHCVYGVYYIQPDRQGSKWTELSKGIEKLETTDNPDEVSDFAIRLIYASDDSPPVPDIFISQTFRRRIYRLDWDKKQFNMIWKDDSPFGTVESLSFMDDRLAFLHEGNISSLDFSEFLYKKHQDILDYINHVTAQKNINCIVIQDQQNDPVIFSELWLLKEKEAEDSKASSAFSSAKNREGLYLPVNHAIESRRFKPILDVMERGGLDMIVIDMKDDYGRLRFTPNNSEITAKGRVVNPLDIDTFLKDMKERGIFTVARIVVFKDPVLAARDNNKYAVWDSRNNRPWVGYEDRRVKRSEISDEDRRNELKTFFDTDDPDYQIARNFYDERWVDPYCEEVWEYTAMIANELTERGFDEIQFDYIRFPTDGANLGYARYRWQDSGMDMESAILSFLRHVRTNVKAIISIDIYGANGWYRTGARKGQEVELLAPWVDVICPMYYPSHFEQHFLAQNPPELRPYRIYFLGTLRTARIGRGQVIVRSWAQAFKLNVSYDRRYYNADYVLRQVEGARKAGDGGITYWNNIGRYEEIPDKE